MVLLILLCCLLISCSQEVKDYGVKSAGTAVFSPTSQQEDTITLRPMNEGETVMTSFTVQNRSGKAIRIEKIHSGCGCTNAVWNKDEIEDGKEAPVTLFFNSSGQFGRQFKTIEVWSNDGQMCRIFLTTDVKF